MPKKAQVIEIPPFHELAQLWDEMLEEEERMKAEVKQQLSESPPAKQKLRSGLPNYREQAMEAYAHTSASIAGLASRTFWRSHI